MPCHSWIPRVWWNNAVSFAELSLQRKNHTYPVRVACSFFWYQIDVMVTNAGETAPSENPSKNRTAAKLAKLCGAARHIHIAPQMMLQIPCQRRVEAVVASCTYTVTPTSFVNGNFDMRYMNGYSATS